MHKVMRTMLAFAASAMLAATASAQEEMPAATDTVSAQSDVLIVIEDQWDAEQKGEKDWIERLVAEDFVGWANNWPAPRNRSSVQLWDRFSDKHGSKMIEHELYPLSILVRDEVAIVHYLYTTAMQSKDGDVEVSNGRYTDILVLTEDGWKFIAWHGGDDE